METDDKEVSELISECSKRYISTTKNVTLLAELLNSIESLDAVFCSCSMQMNEISALQIYIFEDFAHIGCEQGYSIDITTVKKTHHF